MQSGQGFTLVIGLFFDGTGNNAINTRAMLDICREENIDISTPLAGELLARYAQERFGLSGLEATSYTGYFTNIHWLSTLYATEFPAGSHLVQYPVYIEGIGTQAGEPDCLIGQGWVFQTPACCPEQTAPYRLFRGRYNRPCLFSGAKEAILSSEISGSISLASVAVPLRRVILPGAFIQGTPPL